MRTMMMRVMLVGFAMAMGTTCYGQTGVPQPPEGFSGSSLTIGKDFAVVRSDVDLDLKAGDNEVKAANVTQYVETSSVILRDAAGKRPVEIIEQNYDGAITSEQEMLSKYEGQTLEFERGGPNDIVKAKVLRATVGGQVPQTGQYTQAMTVVEFDGKVYYNSIGRPIFPVDAQKIALRPVLRWSIYSAKAEHFPAELSYISGGFGWDAAYNVVLLGDDKEKAVDTAALVGWLTLVNESGTEFENAKLRLFAGDIQEVQAMNRTGRGMNMGGGLMAGVAGGMGVTQKALDEYHVYDVGRPTTLRNHETKQIEFQRTDALEVQRVYEYEGQVIPGYDSRNNNDYPRQPNFSPSTNMKVSVVHVIKNTKANHLGVPLPAGRVRFYRQDTDGAMEFVGENMIGHTAADETLRLTTGASFDIVGERRQTDYHVDNGDHYADESFEVVLRNHKATAVNVDVVEHMLRYANWELTRKSQEFVKRNSDTAVFTVPVAANGESRVTYTVHYTW
jgi:hypothetical protein